MQYPTYSSPRYCRRRCRFARFTPSPNSTLLDCRAVKGPTRAANSLTYSHCPPVFCPCCCPPVALAGFYFAETAPGLFAIAARSCLRPDCRPLAYRRHNGPHGPYRQKRRPPLPGTEIRPTRGRPRIGPALYVKPTTPLPLLSANEQTIAGAV